MKKSIFCAIGLVAVSVFADNVVPSFPGGCGVSDSLQKDNGCYQIGSCRDLYKFAEMVKDEQNICGRLINDIEINMSVLDGYGTLNTVLAGDAKPLDWIPMGTAENPFVGVFLGDGHSINGLYVNDSLTNVGFFGVIGVGARIDSLNILDSYFTSKNAPANIGSIAGLQVGGKIRKVHTGAYVKGGISGATGGIVAKMTAGGISASYNTGRVESDGDFAGGLVGKAESENADIENVIENSFNSGRVTGKYDVGGLVGALHNYSVKNCYNHGSVKGTGEMGGLIGFAEGSVENCYNTGRVEAESSVSSVNCAIGSSKGSAEYIYNNSDICDIYNAFASFSATNITTAALIQDGLPEGFDDTYWSAGYGDKGGDMVEFYINIRLPQIKDINGRVQPVDTVKIKLKDDVLSKEEVSLSDVENVELVFDGESYGSNDFEFTKAAWGEDGSISGKFMGIEFSQDNVSIVFNDENTVTIYSLSKSCTSSDEFMQKGLNVVFKRTLTADGYATMILPFNADIPSDSKASFYEFIGVVKVNGEWQVQVAKTPVKKIAVNTPYLVKVSEDVSSIEFSNADFKTIECESYSVESNGWEIVGSYEYKDLSGNDPELGYAYDYQQKGQFDQVKADAPDFIYPMQVYLNRIATSEEASSLPETVKVFFSDPSIKDSTENKESSDDKKSAEDKKSSDDKKSADDKKTSGDKKSSDDKKSSGDKKISIDDKKDSIIGTINTRTGEFRTEPDRYFDMKGRHLGSKKPAASGTYYNNDKKVIVK